MSLAMGVVAIALFSVLAFTRLNYIMVTLLFMITGGISMMVGLAWYDLYTDNTGLGIGLMFIAYSLTCLGFAFRSMFVGIPRDMGG